jgi:hypothetical protein
MSISRRPAKFTGAYMCTTAHRRHLLMCTSIFIAHHAAMCSTCMSVRRGDAHRMHTHTRAAHRCVMSYEDACAHGKLTRHFLHHEQNQKARWGQYHAPMAFIMRLCSRYLPMITLLPFRPDWCYRFWRSRLLGSLPWLPRRTASAF